MKITFLILLSVIFQFGLAAEYNHDDVKLDFASRSVEWALDLKVESIVIGKCIFYKGVNDANWRGSLHFKDRRNIVTVLKKELIEEFVERSAILFFEDSNAKSCIIGVILEKNSPVYGSLAEYFESNLEFHKSGFLAVDAISEDYKNWATKSFPRLQGVLKASNINLRYGCENLQAFTELKDDGKLKVGFLEPIINFHFDEVLLESRSTENKDDCNTILLRHK